jgi:hypothetical protein
VTDSDATSSEPGDGTFEEPDRGQRAFVGQDFDIREAGGVIDTDVDGFPSPHRGCVGLVLARVCGVRDAESAEFLHVDMHELAGDGNSGSGVPAVRVSRADSIRGV